MDVGELKQHLTETGQKSSAASSIQKRIGSEIINNARVKAKGKQVVAVNRLTVEPGFVWLSLVSSNTA